MLLLFIAFGWLIVSGILLFIIDVVSQYYRKIRTPSRETTLYYGLTTVFALSQILYGIFGTLVAAKNPLLLYQWLFILLSFIATISWLAVTINFMEYKEPRYTVIIFGILMTIFTFMR